MKSNGFTLMEVMIALAILSGSLLVLNNSSSSSVRSIIKAKKVEQIARLLESKVVEMELLNKNKNFEEISTAEAGDFGSTHPELRWDMQVSEFPAPNLAAVALQGSENGENEMLLTILSKFSEHLETAVREMKITVYWTVDERTLEYSVTTLLVDYDAKIALQ